MNQANNSEFRISVDALISLVVTEAENREISAMPSITELNEAFHPSDSFNVRMNSLLRRVKRRRETQSFFRISKRLFFVSSTVITVFACILLPVQAVREAVISTFINWQEQFIEIIYKQEDISTSLSIINNVQLDYIPDDFTLAEPITNSGSRYWASFQSTAGDQLYIRIVPIQNAQGIALDNEYSNYYQISFHDIDAFWGILKDDSNTLLWESDSFAYQISSSCELSEMIKIAEGIHINTSSA